MSKLRKIIDVNEGEIIPLKILAAKAGKDVKNYIQDVLSNHIKKQNVDL